MKGIMKKVTYWEERHFEQDSLLDSINDEYGENYVEDDLENG